MILITEFKIILKDCTIIEMHLSSSICCSYGISIVPNSLSVYKHWKEPKEVFNYKFKDTAFSIQPFLSFWSTGSKSSWSYLNKVTSVILPSWLILYIFLLLILLISICLDKHGRERFLYWGECRENCPTGHYPDEGHTCQPCPDNCELCHSSHVCTRCGRGYFLVPSNRTCRKLECGQGKAASSLIYPTTFPETELTSLISKTYQLDFKTSCMAYSPTLFYLYPIKLI